VKAHIVVGLGFGDEGKGATVDFLCRHYGATLVVRYSGGCQAGHNVQLPDGRRHTFSQFGAGTFTGAGTFLDRAVIIDPLAAQRELRSLVEDHGLSRGDLLAGLVIHPRCLVATPMHRALNRVQHESQVTPHGTCGMGIGITRRYWITYGDDAVFASDLKNWPVLLEKLELMRQRMMTGMFTGLNELDDAITDFSPRRYFEAVCGTTWNIDVHSSRIHHGHVVFEGAQGVLLDERHGCHPHTTWSDVTARNAVELCETLGWEHEIIGCTRTYMTRHGHGPLPTEVPGANMNDPGNPHNEWQGGMRYGYLDLPLLRHAVANLGGPLAGLAVSHLDQCGNGCRVVKNRGSRLWAVEDHCAEEVACSSDRAFLGLLRQEWPVVIEGRGPCYDQRGMVRH
jgi:adenylosuccinate synthase